MSALFLRFKGWILGALGALAAVAAIYFKGRSAGRKVEQEKVSKRDIAEAKQHAETIREVSNAQSNVVRLPDGAVRQQLRDKWTRKTD